MKTPRITALEHALAVAREELAAAVHELHLSSVKDSMIVRKHAAEQRVRELEHDLLVATEAAVQRTAASLGPDSVVKLLDVDEYAGLCDAANRLGRTWKSQLFKERSRGGYYERLGIPSEHHAGIQRAINRLGTRLLDLVATQTVIDDGGFETTIIDLNPEKPHE